MRTRQQDALEQIFEAARAGRGQAMVVRGQSGVGKTTLLGRAVQSTSGFQVARIDGIESEQALGFAGLHRLCAPMSDRLDRLPARQRDALGPVFGVSEGGAPDRFFLGLAVLGLLTEVATEEPLICVVDDAQLLDWPTTQVLAFVARRLRTERIALVFVAREPSDELAGLPELVVEGLSDAESHALLSSVVPGPFDARVLDRIIAESQGNPRALLELSHALTPTELAGGFGVPATRPATDRAAARLASRLDGLAPATRLL
ncbi:MAG: hypothetical protein QOI55_1715, partial [Actinomycetota bacterium]|nr:hypothetical protein [Actinomycetota bacterium]